jgi:hypothetical protein
MLLTLGLLRRKNLKISYGQFLLLFGPSTFQSTASGEWQMVETVTYVKVRTVPAARLLPLPTDQECGHPLTTFRDPHRFLRVRYGPRPGANPPPRKATKRPLFDPERSAWP